MQNGGARLPGLLCCNMMCSEFCNDSIMSLFEGQSNRIRSRRFASCLSSLGRGGRTGPSNREGIGSPNSITTTISEVMKTTMRILQGETTKSQGRTVRRKLMLRERSRRKMMPRKMKEARKRRRRKMIPSSAPSAPKAIICRRSAIG